MGFKAKKDIVNIGYLLEKMRRFSI